jgi:predicted small secreted protein
MPAIPSASSPGRNKLFFAVLALASLALTGCGMLQGSGQVGSNQQSRGEAGINIPFGK